MNSNSVRCLALLALAAVLTASSGAAGQAKSALTVELKEFGFSPRVLEVIAGHQVELMVTNTGALEHDFSIFEIPLEGAAEQAGGTEHDMGHMQDEPELHVAVQSGQSATVAFTPSQPGTYEFWCTVSGHKESGMTGTLVVKAP